MKVIVGTPDFDDFEELKYNQQPLIDAEKKSKDYKYEHCNTGPNPLEPVQMIDDGIVIINDQSAWINASNGPSRNIMETYLIYLDNDI